MRDAWPWARVGQVQMLLLALLWGLGTWQAPTHPWVSEAARQAGCDA